MNTQKFLMAFLAMSLLGITTAGRAADIDIYSGQNASAGNPNLLIVFDNAANFSSSAPASVSTCTLTNTATGVTAANSLAGTVGGIEQCAFYSVLQALPTNTDGSARINIGFMVYNANNIYDYQGLNCGGSNGGCLVYPLTPMAGSTRASLLNWVTTWQTSNGGAGSYWIKAPGEATAATMQEAWAYYAGSTGLSGRSYSGIQPAAGCEKNFVVFIGNSYDNAGSPGDGGSANPASALTTANGGTAPAVIYQTQNTSCGTFSFPTGSSHVTGGFYGDEWSQFMNTTNVYSNAGTPITGTNIVTYTVGVLGPSCQASYAALLTSMAAHGGGKYFPTTDYNGLVLAIEKILNEVQAVNSVFSSATLPVSVNTQGTYLNQVFMGMFRPDQTGNPRWVGNLKQYQFQLDNTTTPPSLFLADANGTPAISSAGTGFISSNAMSFWSCTTSSRAGTLGSTFNLTGQQINEITCLTATSPAGTDPTVGFFANYANYVTNSSGGAFDLQDGELVEKGGMSQQTRLANLYASYPPAAGGTDSPRNMYIYCPSGVNCVANLTDPSNAFSVNNAAITGAMFGTGFSLPIKSLGMNPSVANTATVTTYGVHGLVAGQQVTISGVAPNDYNGVITILGTPAPTANTFSYTVMQNPASPATGSYTASLPSSPYAVSSMSRNSVTSTNGPATVTVTTSTTNPFIAGNTVQIAGASTGYNTSATVATSNGITFTFPMTVNPPATATATYKVILSSTNNLTPSTITLPSGTKCTKGSTYTATASFSTSFGTLLRTGDTVYISDSQTGASYAGTYSNITVLSGNSSFTFSYVASTGSCPGTPKSPSVTPGGLSGGQQTMSSLTRVEGSGTSIGTATAYATIPNIGAFANGDQVLITSANLPANGSENNYAPNSAVTLTCTPVSASDAQCAGGNASGTFTYPIIMTPGQQTNTSGITASLTSGSGTVTSLSLSGTVATANVNSLTPATFPGFVTGDTVNISGTYPANESNYVGSFSLISASAVGSCGAGCQTLTFAVPVTPASPANVSNAAVSAPGITPDRTATINWIRGQDNMGDENSLCPGGALNAIPGANYSNCTSPAVTVRPSVHGDTLHSRPIAVNYGGSTGVVVYYGTNDGVYHAVNGNQPCNPNQSPCHFIGSTPPGGEIWGYVKTEDLGKYNRQRTNSPTLLMPGTNSGITPQPQLKDYFVDGPTALYQLVGSNGSTSRAIIYIGKRRGGRSLTALDVTNPQSPIFLWRINNATTGTNASGQTWDMSELGQTWSLPRVVQVAGYANPLLIFGAGYDDGDEDNDPPTPDIMGRGIYALDAFSGALVWSATPNTPTVTCTTTQCQKQVTGMQWSMPADITLMDADGDGVVERMYATDVGGNIWRVDLEPPAGNTPDKWQVTQFAALGCSSGSCPAGTAPRKFFYPAEVIGHTSNNNYDAVIAGTGDREKPLYGDQLGNNCTNCSYAVVNRLYMLKDMATGNDGSTNTTITEQTSGGSYLLDDCSGTSANPNTCSTITTGASQPVGYGTLTLTQQHEGYYVSLCNVNTSSTTFTQTSCPTGEKVVNAPLATAGYVYFGTNQPMPKTTPVTSCTTTLGIARGYQIAPFSANYGGVVYQGGGLPPSPVSGIVTIQTPNGPVNVPFLIGGANPGCTSSNCTSAVAASRPKINVPTTRHRNYWYTEGK